MNKQRVYPGKLLKFGPVFGLMLSNKAANRMDFVSVNHDHNGQKVLKALGERKVYWFEKFMISKHKKDFMFSLYDCIAENLVKCLGEKRLSKLNKEEVFSKIADETIVRCSNNLFLYFPRAVEKFVREHYE